MENLQNKKPNLFTNPVCVVILALFCCALWGSATPFIKTGYELLMPEKDVASTILFAGIRFTFAGILTIIIYSVIRKKVLYPKKENVPRVLCVSAFQTVIQYVCLYLGLANTSGVKGTIASGTSAFFSVLIASLIFRQEKLTVKKIIACIIGFAGIIVVNLQGLNLSIELGDYLVILSAISLAFSSVFVKRFSKHEDPVVISGYQFFIGGALMVVVGLAFGGRVVFSDFIGVLVLVYLSMLSAVAYAIWGTLLKYNSVSRVTVFSFTTPIFGTILSEIMLTESSGVAPLNLVITLLLVSAGIFLLNYNPRPKPQDVYK